MQRNNDIHHSIIFIVLDPNLFQPYGAQTLFPPNEEHSSDFPGPI